MLRLFFQSIKLAFDAFSQYLQCSWWTRVYLVFDATPQKKSHGVRSGLLGGHSWRNTRPKTLFPNTSWSLCLTLRRLWAGAPSCMNQMSLSHISICFSNWWQNSIIKHLSVLDSSQRSFIEKKALWHTHCHRLLPTKKTFLFECFFQRQILLVNSLTRIVYSGYWQYHPLRMLPRQSLSICRKISHVAAKASYRRSFFYDNHLATIDASFAPFSPRSLCSIRWKVVADNPLSFRRMVDLGFSSITFCTISTFSCVLEVLFLPEFPLFLLRVVPCSLNFCNVLLTVFFVGEILSGKISSKLRRTIS